MKLIDKWIKALRSGKYKQCTGALCDIPVSMDAHYCCLGVLTLLYAKDHVALMDGTQMLPDDVIRQLESEEGQDYIRMQDITLYVDPGNGNIEDSTATALNDDWGYDFNQIADAIENTFRPEAVR